MAHALPAADHVVDAGQIVVGRLRRRAGVRRPALERREEARDLGGIVLQVGVEGQDAVALRGVEAGRQRRRLAEVAAEADAVDVGMLRGPTP